MNYRRIHCWLTGERLISGDDSKIWHLCVSLFPWNAQSTWMRSLELGHHRWLSTFFPTKGYFFLFFLNILTVDLWSVMMKPGLSNIPVFAFSCGRNDSFLLSNVHFYDPLMSRILFFWNMSFDISFLKTKRHWLYIWLYPLC